MNSKDENTNRTLDGKIFPKYIKSSKGDIGIFMYFKLGKFPVYQFENGQRIATDFEIANGKDNREDLQEKSFKTWKARNINDLLPPLSFDGLKIWRKIINESDTIQHRYTVTESGDWFLETVYTDLGKVSEVMRDNIFSMGWSSVKEIVKERNYTRVKNDEQSDN